MRFSVHKARGREQTPRESLSKKGPGVKNIGSAPLQAVAEFFSADFRMFGAVKASMMQRARGFETYLTQGKRRLLISKQSALRPMRSANKGTQRRYLLASPIVPMLPMKEIMKGVPTDWNCPVGLRESGGS